MNVMAKAGREADYAERMIAHFREERSRAKNRDQSTVNSIYPDDPGRGVNREQFAKLIKAEDLTKIEESIELSSPPSEGFRQSLIQFLWSFYNNSLPKVAEIKVSRRALKKELKKAAKLARALEESAARIWSSGDCTVITELSEFVPVSLASQSMRPMHRSGIPFVGVLDEFAKRTARIADELPKDRGGPRPKEAFDNLRVVLEDYHGQLASHGRLDSEDHFPQFMVAVIDVLYRVKDKLPSAPFGLPPNDDETLDETLRKRSSRRNAKRRKGRQGT
jgi:hypothetical protein